MIEELSEDLKPLIKIIFDSQPLIGDSLQLLSGHDDHTHQHSWMVLLLSMSILRSAEIKGVLRPDRQMKLDMALGAILHDVGKTKIPLEILLKPGKLTTEEFELMRQHPTFGYSMVSKTSNLMPVPKAIIAHHHRYLDGSGYSAEGVPVPDRIPDLVRIVTVSDVYDAIVSERPYHVAALPYHAFNILSHGEGSRFDGRFIELLKSIVAIFPVGSFLLFSGGVLCQVEKVPAGDKDNPEIKIIGSFSRKNSELIGTKFSLLDDITSHPLEEELVLGAYSPESLAAKIRGAVKFGKVLDDLIGNSEERCLRFLPSLDESLRKHFAFIMDMKDPELNRNRTL